MNSTFTFSIAATALFIAMVAVLLNIVPTEPLPTSPESWGKPTFTIQDDRKGYEKTCFVWLDGESTDNIKMCWYPRGEEPYLEQKEEEYIDDKASYLEISRRSKLEL